MKGKYLKLAIKDPAVVELITEIESVVDRQNAYGITQRTRNSLLQREKELRGELKVARERARMEASNRSRKEDINTGGLIMFARLPEMGILVFTLVLVMLSSQHQAPAHKTTHRGIKANETIYQPATAIPVIASTVEKGTQAKATEPPPATYTAPNQLEKHQEPKQSQLPEQREKPQQPEKFKQPELPEQPERLTGTELPIDWKDVVQPGIKQRTEPNENQNGGWTPFA